jgi:hypothetical protein
MADAMELSKQVCQICTTNDPSTKLRAFLDAHPQVSVTQFRAQNGMQALHMASMGSHAACMRMLLEQGADVHARDNSSWTALMHVALVGGKAECMQILLEAKADVNVSCYSGLTAAHHASGGGYTKSLQLLINSRANVNARTNVGTTLAMRACASGSLDCLQLLLDNKADLNVRNNEHQDALYEAISIGAFGYNTPGVDFAVLCCNTDAKNVEIDEEEDVDAVSTAKVAACIEEYKHIQAYIDEYHRVLKKTLFEDVPVDPRFGLAQMGIYQEPLERVLEYMGLSMHKDQVVNASIDGEGVERALIPFHVLNAMVWLILHHKEQQRAQLISEQSMHLDEAYHLQRKIDAVFA